MVPDPPNSLVFGRNRAPDALLEKQANSSPLVTVRLRFVTARFWVEKVRKSGPAGFSAARQPAENLAQSAAAEVSITDVTAPSGSVFGAKSAQNVFSCQTASGMPEPQVSLVFGRKQAPYGLMECGVWSVECGVRSEAWGGVECGVWSEKWGVGSVSGVECGVWSAECGVWSEKRRVGCGVWSVEVWRARSVESGVWSVAGSAEQSECGGVGSMECGVWSEEWWSVERGVRSEEWGVGSGEWGVRSGECGVRSVECGVGSGSVDCGVWSVECGVRSGEWGVWSVECGSVECGVVE